MLSNHFRNGGLRVPRSRCLASACSWQRIKRSRVWRRPLEFALWQRPSHGYPAQSLDVRVQPSELASQDLRLHFVEPAVVAWSAGDVVVLLHPVVAESAQGAFDPVVVGDDRTSVAVGAQDLRRVEGERGG